MTEFGDTTDPAGMLNCPAIMDPRPILDPFPITTLSPMTASSTIVFSPIVVSSNTIEFRTMASSPTVTLSLRIVKGPTVVPPPRRALDPKCEGRTIPPSFCLLSGPASSSCFAKSSLLARTYSETLPMSYQNPPCIHACIRPFRTNLGKTSLSRLTDRPTGMESITLELSTYTPAFTWLVAERTDDFSSNCLTIPLESVKTEPYGEGSGTETNAIVASAFLFSCIASMPLMSILATMSPFITKNGSSLLRRLAASRMVPAVPKGASSTENAIVILSLSDYGILSHTRYPE